jgi:AcrR family transcriptional regulator
MGADEEPRTLSRGQERILRAAIEVIAERGYKGASTSEIARRAEVAEGTIFRHFKTKQLLLNHIIEPFLEHVVAPLAVEEFQRLISAEYPSFADFLRALARDRLALAARELSIVRILLQELPVRPELRPLLEKHFAGRILPVMLSAITRFQARGELVATPPSSIARIMLSTIGGYVITRHILLPGQAWDDEAEIELMVQTLSRGLRPA